jgi:hypothetical protein
MAQIIDASICITRWEHFLQVEFNTKQDLNDIHRNAQPCDLVFNALCAKGSTSCLANVKLISDTLQEICGVTYLVEESNLDIFIDLSRQVELLPVL